MQHDSFSSCFRELTSVGAKVIMPTGGFYVFPDFEIVRASLEKRGITTSEQMVTTIFEESSVSVCSCILQPLYNTIVGVQSRGLIS